MKWFEMHPHRRCCGLNFLKVNRLAVLCTYNDNKGHGSFLIKDEPNLFTTPCLLSCDIEFVVTDFLKLFM